MALYTVGHSTFPQTDFLAITDSAGVQTLLDTRSHPGSTNHPQYNKEAMEKWVAEAGRNYEWLPELGGWRDIHAPLAAQFAKVDVDIMAYVGRKFPKQRIAAPREDDSYADEGPTGWTNYGLWDYSWYMALPEFLAAADALVERAKTENVAIFCCEVLWFKCHRSMIADYVVWRGGEAIHLMPKYRQRNKVKFIAGARQIKHSEVVGDRLGRYADRIRRAWYDWAKSNRENPI